MQEKEKNCYWNYYHYQKAL